jgi:hypothetical protein
VRAELGQERVDRLLATEEEAGIVLPKRQQTAVGTERLADGAPVGRRDPADAGEQPLKLDGVGKVGAQVDPGVELEEATRRILDLGQEDGDHRKAAAGALRLGLPVEGELDLTLLPRAEAHRTDEDGHRATAGDGLLQGGKPGLAGGEVVAVEEGGETSRLQVSLDAAHRCRVGAVVAQEDVSRGGVHSSAPAP